MTTVLSTAPSKVLSKALSKALSMVLSFGILVGSLAGVVLVAGPAQAAGGREVVRVSVGAEPDGTAVTLDTTIWTPSSTGRHPVVLLAHGFGGSKDSVLLQAADLVARGYVVVTWSARGHAGSGGRIHLNDPAYEVADAKALVDLAAQRPDVQLDAAGDPRVGVMGASYGGALALMLAGADARIDGVVAAITWNDLAEAFFPQSAVGVTIPGPFKQVWASNFFLGALRGGAAGGPGGSAGGAAGGASGDAACGRFDPTICAGFVDVSQTGVPSAALLAILHTHSPRPTLAQVTAPTMLIQGTADSLFGLDQADATARALSAAGTPFAMRWSDGGHDGASSHEAEETTAAFDWLDHYVAGGASRESAPPTAGFVYTTQAQRRTQPAVVWSLPHYLGVGSTPQATTSLGLSGFGTIVRPPGGQPAAMIAVPGLAALGAGLGVGLSSYPLAALPGQAVAIDSVPVAQAQTVVGSPKVTLTITSDQPVAQFFVSLWRLNGATPSLPYALVAPVRVRVTPGLATDVEVTLPSATYVMPAGSRWRVLVSSTESSYSNDRTPAAMRIVAKGGLTLPIATGTQQQLGTEPGPDTEARLAIGILAALLIMALATALVRRRRRIHETTRPDLADVPLVVSGLVKTYSDGHRAVNDVSWRAEKGQVVGLLGPNGAGKTTTMRMVMGLIRSDAGTVHVLGQPVTAGSGVLNRVGALIEGPGFLPHLTGRANLEAYWAATGRDPAEARIEEAIDVAALGGALDRPVKSYSHGMKQRLGIAQAMLGMPDLLVLDEPTNGLDPPQIAAMRPILRRYADTGRTVVISSHLLAEVEMTCSHVVVMHAGRVVTQGPVADLIDSDDTTILDLASEVSLAPLRAVPGITEVRHDTPTRAVVIADIPRAEVVAAAVESGLPVIGVSSRRHLEEVFLGVISAASGADRAGDNGGPDGGPDGAADSNGSLIERLRQVRAR